MFHPRDDRDQNNEETECLLRPVTTIYTHAPGLRVISLHSIRSIKLLIVATSANNFFFTIFLKKK